MVNMGDKLKGKNWKVILIIKVKMIEVRVDRGLAKKRGRRHDQIRM